MAGQGDVFSVNEYRLYIVSSKVTSHHQSKAFVGLQVEYQVVAISEVKGTYDRRLPASTLEPR
jgi:hypothetical protein